MTRRKHKKSVEIVEKLASLCFESVGKLTSIINAVFFRPCLSTLLTAYHVLSAHAPNLAQYYVGKGWFLYRLHVFNFHLELYYVATDADAAACAEYALGSSSDY